MMRIIDEKFTSFKENPELVIKSIKNVMVSYMAYWTMKDLNKNLIMLVGIEIMWLN
ncbi:hypothetical protein [Arcobacter vandammei]|uniref:hypothetical protein n=1 Tax=Arcobacter vandammei TaxID=2782243 RepID=UPI0018DF6CAB|nr:hypothetical protein [Arcobacter vandammei]